MTSSGSARFFCFFCLLRGFCVVVLLRFVYNFSILLSLFCFVLFFVLFCFVSFFDMIDLFRNLNTYHDYDSPLYIFPRLFRGVRASRFV